MFRIYRKEYGKSNKKVLFFLTGWKSNIAQHGIFLKLLQTNGYRVIAYSFDNEILSPNQKEVHKNSFKVKNMVLTQLAKLKKEGIKVFYIYGESMGALLSLMIANESKEISKIILNACGADLAETVWGWDKEKPDFKKQLLKNKLTLKILKEEWKSIAPINNIDNLQGKKILLYISKKDNIIPYETQAITLFNGLKQKKYSLKLVVNNSRHVITIALNLLRPKIYLNFLKD